ncbi:hypothetical protein APHAL10511_008117 [Amanita phalloides]|nr:hypothetical protein APHAL10511_008117 [Amanita phalloides]
MTTSCLLSSDLTPSKKAVVALENFSMDSPRKQLLIDDECLPESPKSISEGEQSDRLNKLRKKFVGEVDLPESEEPLFKQSKHHSVLFPIQYHDISSNINKAFVIALADMADVQESRSLFLDGRRDGPFQGPS